MTEQALRKMIAAGESTRQEFKSWVKCKDYRQRKELAVKSAVALANTKGGVLLFGVEDDGTITKHQVLRISLTFDHRLLDGSDAARFQQSIRDLLESPMEILL